MIFSKTFPSFLTLKEGSTFLTKPLFPQGRENVTTLRCSEPLRYKVGGASKPCAMFCGMGPLGDSRLQLIVYGLSCYTLHWFFQTSTCKIMNIQVEIAALEAEIAAANSFIAKANAEAEASKRKAEEYSNRASKVEAEVLKLISDPNFPEAERQRILAKLRTSRSI